MWPLLRLFKARSGRAASARAAPGQPSASSDVAPCTAVRGSLLLASFRALRENGHFEHYASLLDESVAQAAEPAAHEWSPIHLAEAHYAACERLALTSTDSKPRRERRPIRFPAVSRIFEAGQELGATPWIVLSRAPRRWSELFEGSRLESVKNGPKTRPPSFATVWCSSTFGVSAIAALRKRR